MVIPYVVLVVDSLTTEVEIREIVVMPEWSNERIEEEIDELIYGEQAELTENETMYIYMEKEAFKKLVFAWIENNL